MNPQNLENHPETERLNQEQLKQDPFQQFEHWYQQAEEEGILESNAMSLATVTAQGEPSLRTVLLKMYDNQGFVFFTNYYSKKAQDISENPKVALLFPWLVLGRQVKIMGTAKKISTMESLRYFATRPRGSQLGAWSSRQSTVISSRQLLEMKFEEMKTKFAQGEVPLPEFWGGYQVIPHIFEFWQRGEYRLHDRFQYTRLKGDSWKIERLAP